LTSESVGGRPRSEKQNGFGARTIREKHYDRPINFGVGIPPEQMLLLMHGASLIVASVHARLPPELLPNRANARDDLGGAPFLFLRSTKKDSRKVSMPAAQKPNELLRHPVAASEGPEARRRGRDRNSLPAALSSDR
jgi:hypothetical protein